MEMVGHTAIVYSVDSHVSGLIVSGSEDHFAKVWKGDYLCLAACHIDNVCRWFISDVFSELYRWAVFTNYIMRGCVSDFVPMVIVLYLA